MLPDESVVPLCPVACVLYVHETRHCFATVFNHQCLHIAVLGQDHKVNKTHFDHNPEEWGVHTFGGTCARHLETPQPGWKSKPSSDKVLRHSCMSGFGILIGMGSVKLLHNFL